MVLSRIVDWEHPRMAMDFLDFGGQINMIIEHPGVTIMGNPVNPEPPVDFSRFSMSQNPDVTIEHDRDKFIQLWFDWHAPSTTEHKDIKQDDLLWDSLRGEPTYHRDKNNMRLIMKMVFK